MLTFIPTTLGPVSVSESLPASPPTKLALILPGYLDSKDYPHIIRLREDLAASGYIAVSIDPLGTWESVSDISFYTISNIQTTIDEIIKHYVSRSDITEIVLLGHSLGGFNSIIAASRNPSISAVVAIMAPYSFLKPWRESRNSQWEKEGYRISKRDTLIDPASKIEFKVPYSVAVDAEKYNVLEAVKNFSKPLLLLAGELDDVVTSEQVKTIYNIANEPKEFKILKGIGHDYRNSKDEIRIVNDVIIDFLNK